MLKLVFASLLIVPFAFGQATLTTAQIAKKVSPSVVVIHGKTNSGEVLGSGLIISKDGKIVTNLHVIRDMKTASVQLANGEVFDSLSVLATDERRDLAVVQIAGFDLPVLELGNSEGLTVGESVVIVGSPRGLEGTVTAGILSSVRDSGEGFKVLQTDASVNPGNSGGPLLNNKAQAIGVVSFKLRSAEGLNFAIPINYVRGLLNNLHEPLTLEQMRRSLVPATSAAAQITGPSLKETLDWLKEKVPLANVQYVQTNPRSPLSVNEQAAVFSLDSCTGVFDLVRTLTVADEPNNRIQGRLRYTVPLGIVTEVLLAHMDNLDDMTHFVSGERQGYHVYLATKGKEISVAEFPPHSQVPITTTSTFFRLRFSDDSIALRIKEAFLHAVELCRKKDIF